MIDFYIGVKRADMRPGLSLRPDFRSYYGTAATVLTFERNVLRATFGTLREVDECWGRFKLQMRRDFGETDINKVQRLRWLETWHA